MLPKLYNVAFGDYLVEGDSVRLLPEGGVGRVVGFDLLSEDRPLVVDVRGQLIQVGVNEAEALPNFGRAGLEPFPLRIADRLASPVRCGRMLSFPLTEGGFLTLVPKAFVPLRQVYERHEKRGIRASLTETLKHSFATRLPHLVSCSKSSRLGAVLEGGVPATDAVRYLLAET